MHCSVCGTVIVAQEVIPALGGQGGNENQGGGNENQGGNNEGGNEDQGGNNEGGNENQGSGNGEGGENQGGSSEGGENQGGENNNQGGNNEGGNGNNPATAVDEAAANAVNIYTLGNTIVVENATDEIRVYDAMGRLMCRDVACRVRTELQVNTAGVYIVKVGNVSRRVVVN